MKPREFYRDQNGNPCWRDVMPDRGADGRIVAERKWQAPKLAPKPQKACDHGLFSDEANQLDLVEMLQEPAKGKIDRKSPEPSKGDQ